MRLILLLLPNVLDSSLGVTLDVANTANQLSRAAGHNALFDILIVSTHRGQTHTANGLVYRRLAKLPSPSADDLVVLPGVLALDDDALSTWLVSPEVGAAVHWLRLAHARGAWIAAGCTGTFVLASSGLLDGLSATTTWWLATSFSSRFPAVRLDLEHMVVGEDRIVTAGAALAQADLLLHLVERFGSQRLAYDCSRFLLFDGRAMQSPYPMLAHLLRRDPFLERIERWLADRLVDGFKVEALAEALHVSPRTLARRLKAKIGISVIDLVHRMRAERAVHLLETTQFPLPEIAARVGYADAATLRRLLQKSIGLTPSGIRARVGKAV